jgi:signal transduction histidine kinase
VTLSARREGETLVLEVADDGPGMGGGAAASGTGFGLHSVRERLRLAGPPHALAIDSTPGHGTRVRITLPLAPPPAARGTSGPATGNGASITDCR